MDLAAVGCVRPSGREDVTVPLSASALQRRYMSPGSSPRPIEEEDLLTLPSHVLLTGDPGGGKTTTVQRACGRLLTTPPSQDGEVAYPIVIVCRNEQWDKASLGGVLAATLGVREPSSRLLPLMADVLNSTRAFLLIDGLDEVPVAHGRAQLERDLQTLGNHLRDARLLISCRSGDAPHLEGFQVAELCPLDDQQIEEVVRLHLRDGADEFLAELRSSPVADLATRPLLLGQMIRVYQDAGGVMPHRPATLYRKLTRLLLDEWDEKRRIPRPSRYAAFGPDEKMQFLSTLSYHLTIEGRARFSTEKLVDIYERICGGFDLPAREATKVAAEIESHNGLIVQSGDMYEFSHLSLQEYLCADYLVRVPDAKRLGDYLDRYPAPVAVAAALSPEPSDWLVRVVMKKATFREKRSVRAFVHRLGRERPGFISSLDLGHAVLKLMFSIEDEDVGVFTPLAKMPQVTEAGRDAVRTYSRRPAPRGVLLSYDGQLEAGRSSTPARGRVARDLWNLVLPDFEPVPTAH